MCFIITQWLHANQHLIANVCLTTQHTNNFIDIPCSGETFKGENLWISRFCGYSWKFSHMRVSQYMAIAEFTTVSSVLYTCSGKLSRKKTFTNFTVLWLFMKVSLQNLRTWHLWRCKSEQSEDRTLYQFAKFFSLESFPLYSVTMIDIWLSRYMYSQAVAQKGHPEGLNDCWTQP